MGGGKGQPQQPQRDIGYGNGPGVRPQMGGGKGQPQPMQSQSYMPPPQMGGGKGQPVGLGQAGGQMAPEQLQQMYNTIQGQQTAPVRDLGFGNGPGVRPQMGGGKGVAGQPAYPFPQQPQMPPQMGGGKGQPGLQPANPANVFPAQQPVRDLGYGNGPGVDLSQYVNTISGQPRTTAGPGALPYDPRLVDIKPNPRTVGQPVNLGQLSQPIRQPNPMMVDPIRPKPFMAQPVKKEDPRQVQQRAMQQLANAKRLGR
jgi:hypothetical protein